MMSADDERLARSVAVEKAYVQDVYEQFSDTPRARRPWPKVNQFLQDLEPGSIVCDVGCGNGKYLNTNPSVFNIGADKCVRFSNIAREKENQVLICDNLCLPFRDECFDAVLSVAVVHHFATTERRICALRELARILRIGGRLIISVWAMEQTHRKFVSQDVLVPWHRPQMLSTPSLELTSTTNTSGDDDILLPYHAYTQTSDSDDSNKTNKIPLHKRRTLRSSSSASSNSSLSSPNETCYSFVRRALQKLAGHNKRNNHRPWFLDTWNSCTTKEPRQKHKRHSINNFHDDDDDENIQDLPIELRTIDDGDELPQRRQTFPVIDNDFYINLKSKSLTDIKTINDDSSMMMMIRSQSGVPTAVPEDEEQTPPVPECVIKTKLVKQKQSICDEEAEEDLDKATDIMKDLVCSVADLKMKRGGVFKQRSMNEELMSTERIREKERVKQNIQKQTSLNEDLIYSLKDSIFSVSTSKRFQLIKTGFTNTFKSPTTNSEKVEKVKNGFVRMFQGWNQPTSETPVIDEKSNDNERKHSREDGSDSSKDSSLQSDTSIDSEDSFASVIYIPKTDTVLPNSTTPPTTIPSVNLETSTSSKEKYAVVAIPKFNNNKLKQQIRDLLQQRSVFGSRNAVRRSTVYCASNGKEGEIICKPIPRLLSLELFNPETDDKDSDSSGISSPDSIDSVINTEKEASSMSLLEAAANVANSLDEAVDVVITANKNKTMQECHKHLTDFADQLNEKLLLEIEEEEQKSKRAATDSIILSKELDDLNKLSVEIQKQNLYLSQLSENDNEKPQQQQLGANSYSEESLPSDGIGGAITYHRYYHVFREGELDQLIERYVENLHIISSYYDHASWCVVAEKVQVWTI